MLKRTLSKKHISLYKENNMYYTPYLEIKS